METIIFLLLSLECIALSTIWYVYLRKKTHIRKVFLWTDNIMVFVLSIGFIFLLSVLLPFIMPYWVHLLTIPLVLGFSFILTMFRFWRTPIRSIKAKKGELVSPADGNVIYIKEFEAGEVPISIKNGLNATLSEITQTNLINHAGWLIGINMTPFDVHKNCIPIEGEIKLVKHIKGKFLSLKDPSALVQNERVTVVIESASSEIFGIVQTASRLVRRIDTYVKEGQKVKQGDWYGMIRFGSQVDILIPKHYAIQIEVGQQVFAKSTIIAKK